MPVIQTTYSMYRVMDEYDMKDALITLIRAHMTNHGLTVTEFCARGGKANTYLSQMSRRAKVKRTTYDDVSTWMPLKFRLTKGGNVSYYGNLTAVFARVAKDLRAVRKKQRKSLAHYRELLGYDYDQFEIQKHFHQPIFFKCLEHFGYKLHIGLATEEPVAVSAGKNSGTKLLLPELPKARPGNGKVVNGFTGW